MKVMQLPAMFSLKLPCAVVITLSKNLLKLNPKNRHTPNNGNQQTQNFRITKRVSKIMPKSIYQSILVENFILSLANEVVQCDTIAVPDQNIEFPKTFNQRKHELLLECGIFTTIYTNNYNMGLSQFRSKSPDCKNNINPEIKTKI